MGGHAVLENQPVVYWSTQKATGTMLKSAPARKKALNPVPQIATEPSLSPLGALLPIVRRSSATDFRLLGRRGYDQRTKCVAPRRAVQVQRQGRAIPGDGVRLLAFGWLRPMMDAAQDQAPSRIQLSTRTLLALALAALATRLLFSAWVHPPGDFLFKDMLAYQSVALAVSERGLLGAGPSVAFQAPGTAMLLVALMKVFGPESLGVIGAFWALLSAGSVVLTALVASRVSRQRWLPALAGVAVLLWYPQVLSGGLFLSEAPFGCALMALVWRLLVLWQERRGAASVGLLAGACFLLRPEVALFLGVVTIFFVVHRRRPHAALGPSLVLLVAPLAIALLSSMWLVHHHTGQLGLAESSRLNLTLARCQSARLQIFETEHRVRYSQSAHDGRTVGSVALWALFELGPEHPFAPRPALGRERRTFELELSGGDSQLVGVGPEGRSIRWSGRDRSDPEIHSALLAKCLRASGVLGQVRASLTNLSTLWFFNSQWPDSSPRRESWRPASDLYVRVFQWIWWLPSLLGLGLAFRERRDRPERFVAALPLLALFCVALVWFGTVRIRTPYDPLAIILALEWFAALRERWSGEAP
jgi:hypothetical protein